MDEARIGIYGLGTMGSALALNLAEKGIATAVANREVEWIAPFLDRAGALAGNLRPADDPRAFVARLTRPRVVLLMIPAGPPVEDTIAQFRPLLERGDLVVDAGNSDHMDTTRRTEAMAAVGLHHMGLGVSGGEEGARHGPSMMLGGDEAGWTTLRPLLEPIAARFQGDPCVAHLGPGGAGHFVKTVHNGIEYADMQMIAEIYGLLRDGEGWDAPEIGALFARWNDGPLASFLVETTARVLSVSDPASGRPLVDMIRDQAGQKGTGRWTLIEALKLGQSAPAIEAAVGARSWSALKPLRLAAEAQLPAQTTATELPDPATLARALYAGRLLAHLQGFEILRAASTEHGWSLDLSRVAAIWRAGCIIRSDLMNDLVGLFAETPARPGWLAPSAAGLIGPALPSLRRTVASAAMTGLPVPALSGALSWYDSIRRGQGTANLIQAQRDAFGRHGFERTDRAGTSHGDWG
ncbi:NADP-dependent phosphogluconate dehydrogenase [Lutimaribacter marinistellae]|uniref:6-phosphogluconate dehydrogenase, decarboxylating n=1 Tax=Lutimaribacter marinistellae TaxID=1820329 RepID=A0ABV7TGC8_9RHOB